MLVLSRRENEVIHIGNDIVITVCSIDPGRVKIGIKAPRSVEVLRGELVIANNERNRKVE